MVGEMGDAGALPAIDEPRKILYVGPSDLPRHHYLPGSQSPPQRRSHISRPEMHRKSDDMWGATLCSTK